MKKLLVYIRDYKKESVLGPLFKLLEASFELIVPLVVARIVDVGVANRDTGYIMQMCTVMVLLAAIGLTCSITAQYFAAKAAVGFATNLRRALFNHIQTLSYSTMDKVGTSTLITRMTSDVNQVQNGVNLFLRLFLRSPFIVFGAMIMAFTVDVHAALTFVVTIPLLSVVVFGIMLISIPLYRKVQGALDDVLKTTRENLTGVRVIRAFNKEESERTRFSGENETLTKMQLFVGKISALMNPLTYVIINYAIIVLVWVGALRVDGGYITQGAVIALVNYMSQILVELVKLANLIININKSIACANRIENVLELGGGDDDAKPAASVPAQGACDAGAKDICEAHDAIPAVEFSHVSLRYEGAGDESLTDIDFRAMRGQTVGVIGGTGSGKTSLVNMIPRFYNATGGAVLVNGVDVKDMDVEHLRSIIGVVPQKAVLFAGTIRDNMRWGDENATDEDIWEALKVAQAKDVVEGKEGKLDCFIEQGGRNLSGGQRQRLTIARALVKKPEILILDDSASALDYATDAALRKALAHRPYRSTTFIVSQRASSIRHADIIIVLDDGKVAGCGTHDELMRTCDVYREIVKVQYPDEVEG